MKNLIIKIKETVKNYFRALLKLQNEIIEFNKHLDKDKNE
jgi:hypothetical protein